MQSLKVIGFLSIPLATSVTAWALWTLAANQQAPQNQTSDKLVAALERNLETIQKPAIYAIRAVGIPIGFASFDSKGEDLEIWLLDRAGRSIVSHQLTYFVDRKTPSEGTQPYWEIQGVYEHTLANQVSRRESAIWTLAPGRTPSLAVESGNLHSWVTETSQSSENYLAADFEGPFPWPFLTTKDKSMSPPGEKQLVFNPLAAKLENVTNEEAEDDPFPTKLFLRLNLFGRIPLDLTILTPESALAFVNTLESHAITLANLSAPTSMLSDLEKLQREAQDCVNKTNDIHRQIVKRLSNAPYLLLRKATLFKSFCEGALDLAQRNRYSASTASLTKDMGEKIRRTLQHEDAELPRSVARAAALATLFDDTKHPLWLRTMSEMIEHSLEELADTVDFEAERKVPVRLKVTLKGKSLGTVVKGVIQEKELIVKTKLSTGNSSEMLTSSWTATPPSLEKLTIDEASPLMNGRALSLSENSIWKNLPNICEANNGKIGIDLGDDSTPFSTDGQGDQKLVWEDTLKIRVLDRFLRRAMRNPECRDILIRAPEAMKSAAESLQSTMEREVVQSKQEIQLKNSRYRYLQLLPGTYQLYVSGLISGELLERFEFTVEAKSKKKQGQQVLLSVIESDESVQP